MFLGSYFKYIFSFFLFHTQKDSVSGHGKSWMQAFNEGYDCLSMRPETDELLKKGISEAIGLQKVSCTSTSLTCFFRHMHGSAYVC